MGQGDAARGTAFIIIIIIIIIIINSTYARKQG